MTYKQWEKKFRRALRSLPRQERDAAGGYYAELYGDKRDAGLAEEDILAEFGDPAAAAGRILEDAESAGVHAAGARQATAGDTAARTALVVIGALFLGIPLLAAALAVTAAFAAAALSGVACVIAGIVQFGYFAVQMIADGASGAYVAHLGIGLAAAGAGCLLIPASGWLTKQCIRLLGAAFAETGRFITGKRRDTHA